MAKTRSGSGSTRRPRARAGMPSDDASGRESQVPSPDFQGATTPVETIATNGSSARQSTSTVPGGVVIDLPAHPRKAPRRREYKPPAAPRFRIFIIDSGWNSVARRVLRHNFALIRRLRREDLLYLLSRKKSLEFIRRHRSLIGRDPIIAVHDLTAVERHGTARFHGFHLHLGVLRTPRQALMALQTFAQFVGTRRHAADLEAEIRNDLCHEGLQGAVEILLHKVPRALGG
jgi:hypothetical protein